MPYKAKDIRRLLLDKFQFEPVEESRHDAIAFFHMGKKIATTRFSRGSRAEVDDSLLKMIARQTRVENLRFFKEMLDCTRSRDDYLSKLEEDGFI